MMKRSKMDWRMSQARGDEIYGPFTVTMSRILMANN